MEPLTREPQRAVEEVPYAINYQKWQTHLKRCSDNKTLTKENRKGSHFNEENPS